MTGGDPAPTHIDLARSLARFHALGGCPCELAGFDPLRVTASRLAAANGVPARDHGFLTARCHELNQQLRHLEFALPLGPIHGDAHTRNLLTDLGIVVLSDFESAAIGPREWDLLPTAIAQERYGLPEEHYQEFADAYGFDVRAWPGQQAGMGPGDGRRIVRRPAGMRQPISGSGRPRSWGVSQRRRGGRGRSRGRRNA